MQFLCINLSTSSHRRQKMQGQLNALDIDVEWVPGVAGDQLPKTDLQQLCDLDFQQDVNDRSFLPGEIGCSLSHLKAYRFMLSRGLPQAVILEDDVVLDTNLVAVATAVAALLDDSRPEVVLLSQAKSVFPDTRREIDTACRTAYSLAEVNSARLAWGYLLNAAAAQSILAGNCPVRFLADDWKRLRFYCDCHISAVIPPMVGEQMDMVSDIRGSSFRKPKRRPSLRSRLNRLPLKLSRLRQRSFRQIERTTVVERTLVSPVDIPQ